MNTKIKSIIGFSIALLIGLGLGYLLFSGSPAEMDAHEMHMESAGVEYTCSMHPQIRNEGPGLCPICEMDLIPLEANSSDNPLILEMTANAMKLADIQTTELGLSSNGTGKAFTLSGKIQADERLSFTQVSHVGGRIEQLFVTFEGERIKKGQKLAIIYSPELITAQKELLQAKQLRNQNPALLKAARKKLSYWKISKEQIQQLEESEEVQEEFTLYADKGGIVKAKRVEVGDHVVEGQSLFDLVDLSKLWVLFDAYESDLPNIKLGQPITFTIPALPNLNFQSRVSFIDPLIDPETRVALVRAEVNNRSGQLKPEMFVQGQFETYSTSGSKLQVPKSAVLWTGKRSVVYVKLQDTEIPSFEYRNIEIGEDLGNSYEVLSGLEAGEHVVTNGSFAIDAAAQLNNQQSMINQLVEIKETSISPPNFKGETPETFQLGIDKMVAAYLELKDHLVETDFSASATASGKLLDQINGISADGLEGAAADFFKEKIKHLKAHTKKIKISTDIEQQRLQFSFLSELLIELVVAYGTSESDIYVQHCPMAFDDTGANWISDEAAILNPYFGDEMLRCGLVEMELPANQN